MQWIYWNVVNSCQNCCKSISNITHTHTHTRTRSSSLLLAVYPLASATNRAIGKSSNSTVNIDREQTEGKAIREWAAVPCCVAHGRWNSTKKNCSDFPPKPHTKIGLHTQCELNAWINVYGPMWIHPAHFISFNVNRSMNDIHKNLFASFIITLTHWLALARSSRQAVIIQFRRNVTFEKQFYLSTYLLLVLLGMVSTCTSNKNGNCDILSISMIYSKCFG